MGDQVSFDSSSFKSITNGRTNGLTWVGARDTCVSKTSRCSTEHTGDEWNKDFQSYCSQRAPENINISLFLHFSGSDTTNEDDDDSEDQTTTEPPVIPGHEYFPDFLFDSLPVSVAYRLYFVFQLEWRRFLSKLGLNPPLNLMLLRMWKYVMVSETVVRLLGLTTTETTGKRDKLMFIQAISFQTVLRWDMSLPFDLVL